MRLKHRLSRYFENPYMFGEIAEKGSLDIRLPAHPKIVFDEQRFLYLVRASISFGFLEKMGLIGGVATYTQLQVDRMIEVLQEEFNGCCAFDEDHAELLKKREEKAAAEWAVLSSQLKN